MNHIIGSEIDILVQAYRNERKEIQKYNIALNLFQTNERSKEFFQKLIKDETLHMSWIKERIDGLDPKFMTNFFDPDILLFKLNDELTHIISVVDMLEYNLYEEKFSALFHNLASGKLTSKPLKGLFSELESAEVAHINSIRYEIDYLKKNL